MTIMQVGIVACLGMKKSPGQSARSLRKESPEKRSLSEGADYGQGQNGHFQNVTKKWALESPHLELG